MKCKLTLINDNWYAENLGETSYLEPYNFLSEGELYKVIHDKPRLLEEGKEVYVELLPVGEPGDIPCEEIQQECKIISLAREILNNTPLEVREKVLNKALEQNLGSRINTLQALFDRFIDKVKETPTNQAFEMTQAITDELIKQLQ